MDRADPTGPILVGDENFSAYLTIVQMNSAYHTVHPVEHRRANAEVKYP